MIHEKLKVENPVHPYVYAVKGEKRELEIK
jgi:hypothetical protein